MEQAPAAPTSIQGDASAVSVPLTAAPVSDPSGQDAPVAAAATAVPVADDSSTRPTDAQQAQTEPAAAPVDPQVQALNDQLKAAREDPQNFNQWVSLVTAAEKVGDIVKLREVYDGFLAEFPLCYGYWKKYADAEHKQGLPAQANAVFERGTAAVPYSVDLWGHHATYKQSQQADLEEIRGVFEHGLAFVGSDFLAHSLWDKYIAFELSQSATARVIQLYERILVGSPIRELDRYYSSFQTYVAQHPASTLLAPEEYTRIHTALHAQKQAAADEHAAAAAPATDAAPATEQQPGSQPAKTAAVDTAAETAASEVQPPANGTAIPQVDGASPMDESSELPPPALDSAAVPPVIEAAAPPADEPPAAAPTAPPPAAEALPAGSDGPQQMELDPIAGGAAPALTAEVQPAPVADLPQQNGLLAPAPAAVQVTDEEVKSSWLAGQDAAFQVTKQEQGRRQPFEAAIKRPYFHIKPLDAAQLGNWQRYLDHSEQAGDMGSTVRLYERCLVACASYADYWVRYVRYLEANGDVEGARSALQRATLIHCKLQHAAHLFAALFEERHGNVDAARAAYALVQGKLAPDLLAAIVQQANFERRQGQREAACSAFSSALEKHSKEPASDSYPFLVLQYAAFLLQAFADAAEARVVYSAALASHPGIRRLWEGAIHFEEGVPGPDRVQRVLGLYTRAVASRETDALSDADREELSARSATFADLNADAATAEQTAAAHAVLTRSLALKATDSRKRPAEAGAAAAGIPAAKQARIDPAQQQAGVAVSSVPPAAGGAAAPYYGQQQGYNYSGYYPSYPPAQQYPGGYPAYPAYQ